MGKGWLSVVTHADKGIESKLSACFYSLLALSLHKVGGVSAIKQAYCARLALLLHKIGGKAHASKLSGA